MEQGVARLNDFALGDIDQLGAHEMQKSARNVGGALKNMYRASGMPSLRQGDEVLGRERLN